MRFRVISLMVFTVFILAAAAQAILPADASAREPQIRAYRQKVRENYEKRLEKRQAEAVRAYEQTRAEIFVPPWMRETEQSGKTAVSPEKTDFTVEPVHEKNRRILVSIIVLGLIAAFVGAVKYFTGKEEE